MFIKGENQMRVSVETRVRCECDNCAEPATKKFSFCYINGRENPASSMYGRDDCTYCSDAAAFSCDACEQDVRRVCCPDGMQWGGTFTLSEHNAYMFLRWDSRKITDSEAGEIIEFVEAMKQKNAS